MNWAEACVSSVALICGTAVVFVLLYLRQQQTTQMKELDRSVQPPSEAPEPPAWIAPPETEPETVPIVAVAEPPTEAYAPPETDVDNLAERLERLERLIDEGG